eukprot:1739672-Prymnesium_polylepis.1
MSRMASNRRATQPQGGLVLQECQIGGRQVGTARSPRLAAATAASQQRHGRHWPSRWSCSRAGRRQRLLDA